MGPNKVKNAPSPAPHTLDTVMMRPTDLTCDWSDDYIDTHRLHASAKMVSLEMDVDVAWLTFARRSV